MRVTVILLLLIANAFVNASELPKDCVKITYYDRNSDGKVDREYHRSCMSHSSIEFFDNDFDGKYEVKFHYAYTPLKYNVDLPVAQDVKIEKE